MPKKLLLQKSGQFFQNLIDRSPDVICVLNRCGRIVYMNKASMHTFGYPPEELIRKHILALILPEDRSRTWQAAGEIMRGRTATVESRFLHQNGTPIRMTWSVQWQKEEGLWYCFARNATERSRLEQTIQKQQRRFSEMFREAPVSMCILKGPDHVFENANELYYKLTGRKNIIGKTVREVFPELEGHGYFGWLDSVYRTGETYSFKETLLRIDLSGKGSFTNKYISFMYQPFRNEEGMVEGIFYFGVDVTEQVLARKKIEESEEKYRHIVELAREGIWVVDENYNTTFANNEMGEILGCSKEEMVGKSLFSFLNEQWAQSTRERINTRVPGHCASYEIQLQKKDKTPVWVHVSAASIYGKEGFVKGAIAMVTDISRRKKEEQVKEIITEINSFFSGDNTIRSSLQKTLQVFCSSYDVNCAEAWVTGMDDQSIQWVASYGLEPATDATGRFASFQKGEGLIGRAWETGTVQRGGDLFSDAVFLRKGYLRKHGLRSVCAVPVVFKDSVKAVVVLYKKRPNQVFEEIDERILFQLGSELQRKITEDNLNRLLNLTPDLLCIVGRDGFLKKVNPTFTRVLGYAEEELLTNPLVAFLHPDDKKMLTRFEECWGKGRGIFHFENRALTKKGHTRHLVWTVTPLPEQGLIFGIAKDVTEMKEVKQKAAVYSNRISVILESITDAFFTIDQQFAVTYWNNQAARLTNVLREDILGKNISQVFSEALVPQLHRKFQEVLCRNVSAHFEEFYAPLNLWFDVSAYPSDEGLSVYFRDITESKTSYQALLKTETNVRNFARQLNNVLEEERCRIAREVHDEFGQQLAGIKMSMSGFRKEVGENAALQRKLDEIVSDVEATMQSLRNFATELRPGILDTLGLLPSLEWLAQEFEKKSGIKCDIDITAHELDYDKAFATCYFRICQEALTNVLKHASASHVALLVFEEQGYLFLEVVDDGVGIVEDSIGNPFSMGILGMQERANLIKGSLVIKRGVFCGTVVQLKANVHVA